MFTASSAFSSSISQTIVSRVLYRKWGLICSCKRRRSSRRIFCSSSLICPISVCILAAISLNPLARISISSFEQTSALADKSPSETCLVASYSTLIGRRIPVVIRHVAITVKTTRNSTRSPHTIIKLCICCFKFPVTTSMAFVW